MEKQIKHLQTEELQLKQNLKQNTDALSEKIIEIDGRKIILKELQEEITGVKTEKEEVALAVGRLRDELRDDKRIQEETLESLSEKIRLLTKEHDVHLVKKKREEEEYSTWSKESSKRQVQIAGLRQQQSELLLSTEKSILKQESLNVDLNSSERENVRLKEMNTILLASIQEKSQKEDEFERALTILKTQISQLTKNEELLERNLRTKQTTMKELSQSMKEEENIRIEQRKETKETKKRFNEMKERIKMSEKSEKAQKFGLAEIIEQISQAKFELKTLNTTLVSILYNIIDCKVFYYDDLKMI
jgi:chromosome segregation ATPase